jgi:predicted nucleic acid-binding protein
MILVDTSIWADHFGRRNARLDSLIRREILLCHEFVTAEIALGNLADPESTLWMLEAMPQARVASHADLMTLLRSARLAGSGIGFVDAHLLAACRLSGARLWTKDKRLRIQADALGLSWEPS